MQRDMCQSYDEDTHQCESELMRVLVRRQRDGGGCPEYLFEFMGVQSRVRGPEFVSLWALCFLRTARIGVVEPDSARRRHHLFVVDDFSRVRVTDLLENAAPHRRQASEENMETG